MKLTKDQLRARIDQLRRILEGADLATAAELDEVAKKYRNDRSKDGLWWLYAELRSFARRQEWRRRDGDIGTLTPTQLETAIAALEQRPIDVELPSIRTWPLRWLARLASLAASILRLSWRPPAPRVRIHPAGWARIEEIEEREWWLLRCQSAWTLLLAADRGADPEASADVCSECNRPLSPGRTAELLRRIGREIEHQRAMIVTQVCAPGPAPVPTEEPARWASRITALEFEGLKEGYHAVNRDMIRLLPTAPKSGEEGQRHWSFVFARLEELEKKPAATLMRDRSLAAIVARIVLEAIQNEAARRKAREESEAAKIRSGRRR